MKASPILVLIALSLSGAPPGHATPAVDLETHVLLTIEALLVEDGRSTATGATRDAEVGPSAPAGVDLVVPWGREKATVKVHLDARLTSFTPDGEAVLLCESSTTPSQGAPVVASREIRLADEGSGLFEVFGDGERRLLLTLRGAQVRRAVVRPRPTLGAPVRFTVAVLRADGDRTVLLETNDLHTFVGQSVEYSFRHGENDGLEAVRLSLLPVSISGDLVTIQAEIAGALPGAGGTVLVSRSERIVASRRATSRLAATAGTPPAGYHFQVTPDF